MKRILILSLICVSILVALAGCSSDASTGKPLNDKKLVVGVTAGPHEQIMEKVKEVAAKKYGLDIEIKVFNDYPMVNVALAEGELDVNSFQHKPYLEQFNKDKNLNLVDIANTVTFPMGIYSNKVKSVKEIKKGDKIGLPNDPTNEARALMLFEQAGLIKLKKGAGMKATLKDIVENPLNLQFVELEAAQIPLHLSELAAAAINTNFAMEHGFVPARDAIFLEKKNSPWVNVLAVRAENKNDPVLKKLIQAYHSEEVKQFIEKTFKGSVIPSW